MSTEAALLLLLVPGFFLRGSERPRIGVDEVEPRLLDELFDTLRTVLGFFFFCGVLERPVLDVNDFLAFFSRARFKALASAALRSMSILIILYVSVIEGSCALVVASIGILNFPCHVPTMNVNGMCGGAWAV